MEALTPDPEELRELLRARMPFGKYRGIRLVSLPDAYLVWFAQRGFPRGHLGERLRSVFEMKANGLGPFLLELVRRTEGGVD